LRSDAVAVLFLAATLGCAHAHVSPPEGSAPRLGERFTLHPGESATIAGTRAKISFERIVSDNRCAVDVVCIVAGEARASLRLESAPGRPEAFTLDTGRNPAAAVAGYRVTLLSVLPLPRSTVWIDPRGYAVDLAVTRE
jgi:hypothetical protein